MEIGRPSEKLQQVRKHAKHGAKYINDAMEIEEKGGKRLIPVVSKRNTPLLFDVLEKIFVEFMQISLNLKEDSLT